MILGLGIDCVDIRRMEKALQRFPQLIPRLFTPAERQYAATKVGPMAVYAKRFAAKEAFLKAMGSHVGPGYTWQDVEILSGQHGKPQMSLSQALHHLLCQRFSVENLAYHVSLTDEYPYAQAVVILESTPQGV